MQANPRATQEAPSRTSARAVPDWLADTAGWVWRILVITAGIALLLWALAKLYLVVLPVFAALILATFLVPPTRWLMRHGVPRTLATVTAYVGGILLVLLVLAFVVQRFVAEGDELVRSVQQARQQIVLWLQQGPLHLSSQQINDVINQAIGQVRQNRAQIVGGLVGGASLVIEVVGAALLAIVILFFFVRDGDHLSDWFLSHLPESSRDTFAALGSRAWWTLGGYIRGVAVIGILDAIPTGIALVALGVPLVVPLMVLIFLGAFLPVVGAFLSGLAAVLVAFASRGLGAALVVFGVIVVVQQVEGNVFQPWIMGRRLPLHPVIILLALTAGGVLAGIAGAALAVPAAGVLSAVGNEWRTRRGAGGA